MNTNKYRAPSKGEMSSQNKSYVTIGEIIEMHKNGTLVFYTHNRKISRKRVNEIKGCLDLNGFGEITVADFGPFNKHCDGHHRVRAIYEMYIEGKLSSTQLNQKVSLVVVREDAFLQTYKTLNKSKSHSSSDHLTNPDLTYGHMFNQIQRNSSFLGMGLELTSSQRQGLLDVMIAFQIAGNDIQLVRDVYAARSIQKDLLNEKTDPNDHGFNREILNKAGTAIVAWGKLYQGIEETQSKTSRGNTKWNEDDRSLATSVGLFTVFMLDHFNGGKYSGFTQGSTKRQVNRALSKRNAIVKLAKTVAQRNQRLLKDIELATLLDLGPVKA